MIALLSSLAFGSHSAGSWNTDATLYAGFRPGVGVQLDRGLWRGFWVAGRLGSQKEAYAVASNLGEFTEKGTYKHGVYLGAGVRHTFGKQDRWDLEVGAYAGSEWTFVRETVVYNNSGQTPPYSVRDRRHYQSWQAGLTVPLIPTFRYRFAKNHGVVFQPWYPLSAPLEIERSYIAIGWTARWQ